MSTRSRSQVPTAQKGVPASLRDRACVSRRVSEEAFLACFAFDVSVNLKLQVSRHARKIYPVNRDEYLSTWWTIEVFT
jgi:hypothetical protein